MSPFSAIWRHINFHQFLYQKERDKEREIYLSRLKKESWHHLHQTIQVSKITNFKILNHEWMMFTCGIRAFGYEIYNFLSKFWIKFLLQINCHELFMYNSSCFLESMFSLIWIFGFNIYIYMKTIKVLVTA